MAPHSSTLAWKIPWTEEPVRLQSIGLLRVGHDWATSLSLFTFMHWRRQWQPTPVLAWRIPGTGEPGGLPSMGSHRVGHVWSDLAAAASTNNKTFHLPTWKSFLHSAIIWASPWVAARFSFRSFWSGLPKLCFLCITLEREMRERQDSNVYIFLINVLF